MRIVGQYQIVDARLELRSEGFLSVHRVCLKFEPCFVQFLNAELDVPRIVFENENTEGHRDREIGPNRM